MGDELVLKVEEVRRRCPPSCRLLRDHEPCACATESKVVSKVLISATWNDAPRRYRAWFTPNPKNSQWPRISNKERFNEQGILEVSNVKIPDEIYRVMATRAIAIIRSGGSGLF